MKGWGIALLILGVIVAIGALVMETTVYSPGVPGYGGIGSIGGGSTYNLGLLQTQELIFLGGCALFVAGAVLTGAGAVIEQLRRGAMEPAYVPAMASETLVELDLARDQQDKLITYLALGALLLVAVVMLAWSSGPGRSARESTAIENTADAIADNMEMQADNLDRMADEAIGKARRR